MHERHRVTCCRSRGVARLESEKPARLLDARMRRVLDVVTSDFRVSLIYCRPPLIPGEKLQIRLPPEP